MERIDSPDSRGGRVTGTHATSLHHLTSPMERIFKTESRGGGGHVTLSLSEKRGIERGLLLDADPGGGESPYKASFDGSSRQKVRCGGRV